MERINTGRQKKSIVYNLDIKVENFDDQSFVVIKFYKVNDITDFLLHRVYDYTH